MGELFKKTKSVVKRLDPELVSLGLTGLVIGIVSYKPEYTDQLLTAFELLKRLVTDESVSEEEFHKQLEKTLSDIGVKDENAKLMIELFLAKLDKLAEKYLDVEEGFTKEEREAWASVFDDLITALRLYNMRRGK